MKKTLVYIGSLAALLVLVLAFKATEAQPAEPAKPLKVAILNVSKVIMECQEYLDKDKAVKDKSRELQAELEKLDKEAATIENELKSVLQPGTPEYKKRLKEWFDKSAQVKAMGEYEKEAMKDETYTWTRALYDKLQEAAKNVARRDGYTLVLNMIDSKDSSSLTDLYVMIRSRQVLYSTPEMDMTAKVIEYMDTEYAKVKK